MHTVNYLREVFSLIENLQVEPQEISEIISKLPGTTLFLIEKLYSSGSKTLGLQAEHASGKLLEDQEAFKLHRTTKM